MRYVWILIIVLAFNGCQDQDHKTKLENLNGYWIIDIVEKPDGEKKEYPFTNHMDFFDVNENYGTKSRVSPTYSGTFISYGAAVKFVWEEDETQLLLRFEDGEQAYSQILKKATEDELVLVHEDGTKYYYKSYKPDAK